MIYLFDSESVEKYIDILNHQIKNFIKKILLNIYLKERNSILVAAYRNIRKNLPLRVTYNNYPDLSLPNTTNLIEGRVFSTLKILIKIHRGLSKSLKLKIVDYYLMTYRKK